MTLTYIDYMGHNELCKDNCILTGVESKTGDCEEPDYIEVDSESHGRKFDRELFCITGKDLDYIDVEDLKEYENICTPENISGCIIRFRFKQNP